MVGSYGLGGDEFAAEELEDACADIQETLQADNYEDQLPQPEVNRIHLVFVFFFLVFGFFEFRARINWCLFYAGRRIDSDK